MTTDSHEALRTRMRAHLETHGASIGEAARGIGMSAPAVTSWLGAKYRGDNDRVARLVARWLDTEHALEEMRTRGLERHVELSVTMSVQLLAAHAQADRDLVLAYGAAGAGKSWALERFCAERSAAWYVSMSPAESTCAAVLRAVAEALDAGAGTTGAAALARLVVGQLSGRNALLVVDEAHHLSAANLDMLRCVYDRAKCGLVLAGNDPLWSRLASGARAAQLVSRVGARKRFTAPTEADALALAEGLMQREPAGKGRKAVLGAARGLGGLRAVGKLVAQAMVFARADYRESVGDADLVDAAAHMGIGL